MASTSQRSFAIEYVLTCLKTKRTWPHDCSFYPGSPRFVVFLTTKPLSENDNGALIISSFVFLWPMEDKCRTDLFWCIRRKAEFNNCYAKHCWYDFQDPNVSKITSDETLLIWTTTSWNDAGANSLFEWKPVDMKHTLTMCLWSIRKRNISIYMFMQCMFFRFCFFVWRIWHSRIFSGEFYTSTKSTSVIATCEKQ